MTRPGKRSAGVKKEILLSIWELPISGLGKVDRPEGNGVKREEKICDFFSGTQSPSGQL